LSIDAGKLTHINYAFVDVQDNMAWLTNRETDVSFETLQNSAVMYLGMKKVLKDYEANAITLNFLGGFYGGHIHAYPCLGFHEPDNEGLIGACECDINSTATMVAYNHMTGGGRLTEQPVSV
jgi:hypothetical protein